MYLLIKVGGYIGALPTILLVMATAVVGVLLLRIQGVMTLTRGLSRLQGGELPAREVVEGLLLAVAGALLLTPGFVTDSFGFLLLIPPIRMTVAQRLLRRVVVRTPGGPAGGHGPGSAADPGADRQGPVVIEGEFESRSDPEDPPPAGVDSDRR